MNRRPALRSLLAALLLACAAGATARAQTGALAWRQADERLTRGMNPSMVMLRGDPAEQPVEQPDEEERTLITLLREKPGNQAAQVRLAEIELRKGLRARAADRYLSAARQDGTNRDALSGLAVCLIADNSLAPAAKLLQEMQRKGLAEPVDRFNLAFALFRLDKRDEAARELESLLGELEARPKADRRFLAATAFNLAGLRLAQNRAEDAARLLAKVKAWEGT